MPESIATDLGDTQDEPFTSRMRLSALSAQLWL